MRQEAGWIRERAVREVSDVRVQAAHIASQAQQAVQTAQQSEAQARQLIEQTRQEAIGHVENARQVVNATQQDAQQEVQRIVQEAQQAISQREQTIASQEHTIRGLSQENSVMHQRLGDLERVVAHLTQQARATPVPIQESPPKAASIAETATETSAAKASSQGTVLQEPISRLEHLRFQIHKMPPVLPHRRKGMLFQVLSPTLRAVLLKVQDLVTMPQLIQGTLVGVQQVNISQAIRQC